MTQSNKPAAIPTMVQCFDTETLISALEGVKKRIGTDAECLLLDEKEIFELIRR